MITSAVTTAGGALLEPLAFEKSEYDTRLARVRREMNDRGFAALLSWTPENILYLTGHDTPGYYFYQCCLVTHTHEPVNVLRRIEATNTWGRSAYRHAATYDDYEDPILRTVELLEELNVLDGQIGVEGHAWFMPPARFARLEQAITRAGGQAVDAGMLVESFRVVKSPRELEYIRQACSAADAAMEAAVDASRQGVKETDVAAAVWQALMSHGSQLAGLPPFIVSGPRSSLCHATWSDRSYQVGDPLLYELPGVVERYVGALVRTGSVGEVTSKLKRHAEANIEVLDALIGAIHPGLLGAELQALCHREFERHGFGGQHVHRSGYSIGLNYAPDWGEGHIFSIVEGNEEPLQENMTFHLIPGLRIDQEYTMMFSQSVRVTATGCETLTTYPASLFITE